MQLKKQNCWVCLITLHFCLTITGRKALEHWLLKQDFSATARENITSCLSCRCRNRPLTVRESETSLVIWIRGQINWWNCIIVDLTGKHTTDVFPLGISLCLCTPSLLQRRKPLDLPMATETYLLKRWQVNVNVLIPTFLWWKHLPKNNIRTH